MDRGLPLGVHVEDDNPISGGLDEGPEGIPVDFRHLPDGRLQAGPRRHGPPAGAGGPEGPARRPTLGSTAQGSVQRGGRRRARWRRRRRSNRRSREGDPKRHFELEVPMTPKRNRAERGLKRSTSSLKWYHHPVRNALEGLLFSNVRGIMVMSHVRPTRTTCSSDDPSKLASGFLVLCFIHTTPKRPATKGQMARFDVSSWLYYTVAVDHWWIHHSCAVRYKLDIARLCPVRAGYEAEENIRVTSIDRTNLAWFLMFGWGISIFFRQYGFL